jgi:SRSO17 transposase
MNCWTISEHAGHATPDKMRSLLARAVWDADTVRDDVRDLAVEHLGGTEAMLVVDETGDVKKGTDSVGVRRQYTGTAGQDRERAGRGVLDLHHSDRAHADRPGDLPAALVERRSRPL